jgi:hypothetical protein
VKSEAFSADYKDKEDGDIANILRARSETSGTQFSALQYLINFRA